MQLQAEREQELPASSALLSHLQRALEASSLAKGPLAPRGTLRLHLLFSQPTPAGNLYPLAHVQPARSNPHTPSKQQQLVLPHPIQGFEEHIFLTATWTPETVEVDADSPATVVYALECFLYTLPAEQAALLYVSKLDSTGYGPRLQRQADAETSHWVNVTLAQDNGESLPPAAHTPLEPLAKPSIARVLTQAFMHHFASLAHWQASPSTSIGHVSIHILARAQATYLFPGSPQVQSKRVLSDAALISWWRSCVGGVVRSIRGSANAEEGNSRAVATIEARPYYMIPGYARLDSHPLVPLAQGTHPEASTGWVYGHPYSRLGDTDVPPLPLHLSAIPGDIEESVATLIPHFADDPKSRFINEIARDAHERPLIDRHEPVPVGKVRQRHEDQSDASGSELPASKRARLKKSQAEEEEEGSQSSLPPSSQTRVGESFDSQDTLAPSVPEQPGDRSADGRLVFEPTSPDDALPAHLRLSPHTLRSLAAERAALDAIPPDDFWERMGYRQECCAGNAVGAFVVGFTAKSFLGSARRPPVAPPVGSVAPPPMQPLALPNPTLPDLVLRHLLRDACDWSTPQSAAQLTRAWDDGVQKALVRKGGIQFRNGAAVHAMKTVGEGIIWSDTKLCGPTRQQLQRALSLQEEAARAGRTPLVSTSSGADEQPKVNMLSVKRKKKPPASTE